MMTFYYEFLYFTWSLKSQFLRTFGDSIKIRSDFDGSGHKDIIMVKDLLTLCKGTLI